MRSVKCVPSKSQQGNTLALLLADGVFLPSIFLSVSTPLSPSGYLRRFTRMPPRHRLWCLLLLWLYATGTAASLQFQHGGIAGLWGGVPRPSGEALFEHASGPSPRLAWSVPLKETAEGAPSPDFVAGRLRWLAVSLAEHAAEANAVRVVQLSTPVSPLDSTYLAVHLLPVLARYRVDYVVSGSGARHNKTDVVPHDRMLSFVHFEDSQREGLRAGPVDVILGIPDWGAAAAVADKAVVFALTDKQRCPLYLSLFERAAPETVHAFVHLVESGWYNKTVFYRAEPGFVLQGGGRRMDKSPKQSKLKGLPLEAVLPNKRHTVAMARSSVTTSGTTDYFINLTSNRVLDKGGKGAGYAVFAQLIGDSSADTARAVAAQPTDAHGRLHYLKRYEEIHAAYTLPYKQAVQEAAECRSG